MVPLCDLSFSTGAEEEKGEAAGSRVTRDGPARALGEAVKQGRACVGREGPASGLRERRRDIARRMLAWDGGKEETAHSLQLLSRRSKSRDMARHGRVGTVGKYRPQPCTRSRENAATLVTCRCDLSVSPYRRCCLCLHSTPWGMAHLKLGSSSLANNSSSLHLHTTPSHFVSPIRPFRPSIHPDITSTLYIPHSSVPYCSVSCIRVGAACDVSSTSG